VRRGRSWGEGGCAGGVRGARGGAPGAYGGRGGGAQWAYGRGGGAGGGGWGEGAGTGGWEQEEEWEDDPEAVQTDAQDTQQQQMEAQGLHEGRKKVSTHHKPSAVQHCTTL